MSTLADLPNLNILPRSLVVAEDAEFGMARTQGGLRLAVLAALNIADEYQVLKRKYDAIAGSYSARASELSNLLSDALEEGRRVS